MKRPVCILLVIVSLVLGLSLFEGTAQATSGIEDIRNFCTVINCGGTIIRGVYQSNTLGDADPFVIQILSDGPECVRLDLLLPSSQLQADDLQMVLVSPSGRIWANDDRSLIDNRPLIKAITDVQGWYTLFVSSFDGLLGLNDVPFTLSYGRYNAANINCSAPTPFFAPLSAPEASKKREAQQ